MVPGRESCAGMEEALDQREVLWLNLEAPFLAAHVTLSRIIEVQIFPGDAMLVQVDPVHSPHEHETDATLLAELIYERFPIGLHSPINLATAVAPAAQCFACPLAEPFRSAPA